MQGLLFSVLLSLVVQQRGTVSQGANPLISISLMPLNRIVVSESSTTFSCEINEAEFSALSYAWYHDGRIVTSGEGAIITPSNGGQTSSLTLTVTDDRVGMYWCVADLGAVGSVTSLRAQLQAAYTGTFGSNSMSSLTVSEGIPLAIPCNPPESVPSATLEWYIEGESVDTPVTADTRISVSLEGALIFSPVRSGEDAGRTYFCQVTNTVDASLVETGPRVVLMDSQDQGPIFSDHTFVSQPSNASVLAGEDATFGCFSKGSPADQVKWFKDGTEIAANEQISFLQNKRILFISSVQSSNEGRYYCQIEQVGFDNALSSTSAYLEMLNPPTITQHLANQSAEAETETTLRCDASGSTPFTWSWIHNSKRIVSGSHFVVDGNELTINDLGHSDSGVFQCVVEGIGAGQTAQSIGILNVNTFLPHITVWPKRDILTFSGSEVQLPCLAEGAPSPQYSWTQDGTEVQGDRFAVAMGTLTISNSLPSDSGSYVCVASNDVGRTESLPTLVDIINELPVASFPAMSVIKDKRETVKFECELQTSLYSITYQWTHDGQIIISNSRIIIENGNLTIHNLADSDTGEYECVAQISKVGSTATSVQQTVGSTQVTVTTEPHPPRSLSVHTASITSSAALLSWTPPTDDRGRAVTGYSVDLLLVSVFGPDQLIESDWLRINQSNLPTVMTSYEVTGLFPYTAYQFRVHAININGEGLPSQPSETIVTKQSAPTLPPFDVTVSQTGQQGLLNVSWNDPLFRLPNGRGRNGIVTSNTVSYRLEGDEFVNKTTTQAFLIISDLVVNALYQVKVRSSTMAGDGPFSDIVTASTGAFNTLPVVNMSVSLISDLSDSRGAVFNVSWLPPNISQEFLAFFSPLFYRIRFIDSEVVEREVNVTVTMATVLFLNWGQQYNIIVHVFYDGYEAFGPPSVVTMATPKGPPGPVSDLTFSVESGNLILNWKLPHDGGGTIANITIEGFSSNEGEWSVIASSNNTEVTTLSIEEIHSTGFTVLRVVACSNLGCSWGADLYNVTVPMATTTEPFYTTIWFIAVVSTVSFILLIIVLIVVAMVIKRSCNRLGKSDTFIYNMSENAGSEASMFSIRQRHLDFVHATSQNDSLGEERADSTLQLDTQIGFGPPDNEFAPPSSASLNSVSSSSQLRSTNSLLQAKYSGTEHHWLNQGFSQDTPEHHRRRDFIRGLSEVDGNSIIAESVASTYV